MSETMNQQASSVAHKTIGILAHVDAGKTTFAEQLLFHTGSIRQRGRVDHKNAFLDSHEIEKQRGITVFSDQAVFSYQGSTYYLVDTPGHVDFSPEMERTLNILDYAIVIISAVEGIEGHTETVWQLLRRHRVPTFFFINKIDRVGADPARVLEEIHKDLTEDVCDINGAIKREPLPEELIEFVAERDEALLEEYVSGRYSKDRWLSAMREMIKECRLFPCAFGSALQDIGIVDFLEKLDLLTASDYSREGPFAGRVYKIRHDEGGARVTFIKALKGRIRVRDEICYGEEGDRVCEKVTQIRVYNGSKYVPVEEAGAGELFAVTGLSSASIGDGLGALKEKARYEMIPTLKAKVLFDPALNVKDVLRAFRILEAEDPSLNVTWEEALQEIDIHVMGLIQLEVLQQLVEKRFGFSVSFGQPEILYKETIEDTVIGYGHFEPLKHYAEVHLKLEPGERGSGIVFQSQCHPDTLPVAYQNLIRHHIFERDHHGLLTGSPLTDLKITLINGRAHVKHTSGGDFREATYRALRQGLEKARNVLLEPYFHFRIKVETDQIGRVLSDIQNAHGSFEPPMTTGDKVVITGSAPVATFMNYSTTLAAFTQGRGSITLFFGGYRPCHNADEVIQKKGYNKNADPEYTSSSMFCANGRSFSVPWDKAEEYMHCL